MLPRPLAVGMTWRPDLWNLVALAAAGHLSHPAFFLVDSDRTFMFRLCMWHVVSAPSCACSGAQRSREEYQSLNVRG